VLATVFSSDWFGFLLQVVGIAVAGWVVLSLFGARRRGAFTLALAGVGCALLAGQYAVGVRGAVDYLKSIDKKFTVVDKAGARTWCVNEPGLPDLNFIRFVQANMPNYARYELFMPPAEQQSGQPMCLALILAPSVQTTDPARAQYAVFFGAIPPQYAEQAVDGNPDYAPYAPNMGVLKVGG
jgi:hypothetical protein